jgi:NAD(P)H-dependent FMN reductase
MINVTVLTGGSRPDSTSLKAAKYFSDFLKTKFQNVTSNYYSPLNFEIPYDGASDPKYSEIVKNTDAFIIIVPEYNHGYPGKLKSLLDSEYSKYKDKPVMLIGWSSGGYGGVRGVENLIPVVRQLGMIVTKTNLNVSNNSSVFNEDGELIDLSFEPKMIDSINELLRITKLVKNI